MIKSACLGKPRTPFRLHFSLKSMVDLITDSFKEIPFSFRLQTIFKGCLCSDSHNLIFLWMRHNSITLIPTVSHVRLELSLILQ